MENAFIVRAEKKNQVCSYKLIKTTSLKTSLVSLISTKFLDNLVISKY